MSNYAALIDVLSVAGSRLSDGSPNSSGVVYFFQPGTNTPVNAYSDAAATTIITQPVVLTSGGLLNTSTFPNGIFVTQPVRLLVQDVSGNSVVDTTYIPATAGDVGYNPSQDDAAFTTSTLNDILQAARTSFGGTDWNYLVALGQTERPVGATITEICVSVKSFGAKGDGVAIDTTSIQNAMNFVKAAGGGVVWFPAGTYKIDQALALTSANGVTIAGAGIQTTIITSSHATANAFTFTTCDGLTISRLSIRNSGTSTGAAISLVTCLRANVTQVHSGDAANTDGVYRYAISANGSSSLSVAWSHLYGISADAAARGILATSSPGLTTIGGELHGGAAGYPIEFDGISGANIFGTTLAGSPRFAATMTSLFFSFVGSSMSAPSVATATIPIMRTFGTSVDASATSSAVGAAQTPSLIAGNEVILSATSGGAGTVTVNAPAILPGTGASFVDLYWDFVFKNASAGAVTWSLNAVFVVNAAIPTTDGHTIGVRFRWDRATSKLREVSRADTVT